MADGNVEALEGEQTLAMMLEFLAQLQSSQQKDNVIKEIKEKVKRYFKDDGEKFGNNDYLAETIRKSSELRTNIVMSEEQYEHYNTQFQDGNANKYAQHLINNIFPLFGCLYYMYFECSNGCTYFDGGGMWQSETCDGNGGGQYLNKWLRDLQGQEVKPSDNNGSLMIKRGFNNIPLNQKDGKQLFPPIKSATALLYYREAAQLQSALFFMLLLPDHTKWNRGQSGHAVLFLESFCEKVNNDRFKDKSYKDIPPDTIKSSCKTLKNKVTVLIQSNTIAPVATENKTVQYNDLLQPEHFSKYMEWLEHNLEQLIKSLTEMASDVSNWEKNALKESKTFGPYPWGFTFKDGTWEEKEKLQQIQSPLSALITALTSFKNAFLSISEAKDRTRRDTDSSSPASTVGSVIGGVGAAAATAGAAYAGSGFLGPVAESIGKFVRGLFI